MIYLIYGEAKFLPYISEIKERRRSGFVFSTNLDPFRYTVELTCILLISRIINFANISLIISILFLFILAFNIYQYVFRRVYEAEPILYNDLKLIRNAIVIVWSESRVKMLLGIISLVLIVFLINYFFKWFLLFNSQSGANVSFMIISILWILGPFYSILKFKGLYRNYPNDIYLRYHFTIIEFIYNLRRGLQHKRISKRKIGSQYQTARSIIKLGEVQNPPNIYFFFIESYGSYFYNEVKISSSSFLDFNKFQNELKSGGFHVNSTYSESTTIGGQSWLTYNSFLFGCRLDNNTLFEACLNDVSFRRSNSILALLKNAGYTNYNLNPINPINGINVPYKELREMNAIDRWVLHDDIAYHGDSFGFGACAPDQYSLNFTMSLIRNEKRNPYTLFYLTKNSHSPFITPDIVENWEMLNNRNGQVHVHKGFLKNPQISDYQNAIRYELEVLKRFILDYGSSNDLFVLIGDHQPPMLAKEEIHGLSTPVHIVSKKRAFLQEFDKYGFGGDLEKIHGSTIRHEAFYSIFLNAFTNQFCKGPKNIPRYEPEGIKL